MMVQLTTFRVRTKPREPIDLEKRSMPKIPSDIGEQSVKGFMCMWRS